MTKGLQEHTTPFTPALARGLIAKHPVRRLDRMIQLDWRDALEGIVKLAIGAVALDPAAIEGAAKLVAALRPEDPPEARAWHLIRRSLGRAMAELTAEAVRAQGTVDAEPEELIEALDDGLADVEVELHASFLERPTDLPFLAPVGAAFARFLKRLELNDAEARAAADRLPRYFAFALHRTWAEAPEDYGPLRDALDTPFARAAERERGWLVYADWLEKQLDAPLFGEVVSLRQLYVPLRAYREEKPHVTERAGRRAAEDGPEPPAVRHVVDAETALDAWLAAGDKEDTLRVLCGGPGSGKSSVAKSWAAKLARRDARVLLVPLHLLDDFTDLDGAIGSFALQTELLRADPLDAKEGERHLVLILDGLDELSMQGKAGLEAAEELINAVQRLLGQRNTQRARLHVLLGGRELLVTSLRGKFDARQVLHLLPYHQAVGHRVEDTQHDRRCLGAHAVWRDPGELLADDQRDRWWQRWGKLTGTPTQSIPETIRKDQQLADIAAQPLLNHLLAISHRRGGLDGPEGGNLNRIYASLLASVWERRWGESRASGTRQLAELERLEKEDFFRVFETVGLTLSQRGGGRSVTAEEVENACREEGLIDALKAFRHNAERGALSLLTAFYFRRIGRNRAGQDSFELTHKSFGEYLAARRLVRLAAELDEDLQRPRAKVDDALRDWLKLTGDAPLSREILEFLYQEVELKGKNKAERWQATLIRMFNLNLSDGMPAHVSATSFREAERRARNAEETLLEALTICAGVAQARSPITWPTQTSAEELLSRLCGPSQPRGTHSDNLILKCLCYLELAGQTLSGRDLEGADLEGADLEGADLRKAKLSSAKLKGAKLSRADLRGADLRGAHLGGAGLSEANLRNAIGLTREQLESASDLEGARLPPEFADLEAASRGQEWGAEGDEPSTPDDASDTESENGPEPDSSGPLRERA